MADLPRCAYCRERPVVPAWRPFCSERCRMADLGRWLSANYRIPGTPAQAPPSIGADDEPDDGPER